MYNQKQDKRIALSILNTLATWHNISAVVILFVVFLIIQGAIQGQESTVFEFLVLFASGWLLVSKSKRLTVIKNAMIVLRKEIKEEG